MRRWVGVVVAVAVMAVVGWAWWIEPPAVLRRLPAGQALLYLNCRPLRQAQLLSAGTASLRRAPSYAAFVHESGFDFERDLDAVGISMEGSPLAPRDTTVILEGRFEPQFTSYLHQHAQSQEPLDGRTAYRFPGWARPQQTLTVVPLGAHDVLVTNAAAAAPIVQWAQRRWALGLASPQLWQPEGNTATLLAYAGVNTQALAAERALDGTQPPLQGLQRVAVRLRASAHGLTLNASAPAATSADAAATVRWLQDWLQNLRRRGGQNAAAFLQPLQVGRHGQTVQVLWPLGPTQLAQWRQGLARPAAVQP